MLDPAIREIEVKANGLRFKVLEAGVGDRLALCLHGFPELGFSWRNQLPVLAELGFRAWAPDLRGYGGTDRPQGMRAYAIENLLDDVASLIDASGAKETLLVAHDWGGVIAWYFALRRIRPLSRLVVMNLPHPAVFERVLRSGWRQRLRSWYALFFQLPWLPERLLRMRNALAITEAFRGMAVDKSRFPEEVLDVYRRAALEPGALTAMINYYRALVRGGGARRQRSLGFPRIETATLMVWGEQDRALGVELTYGTEAYVPNLVLRYLPNASHWVQQDAPDDVNAILREWLAAAPARASD
jgi:pimeloyl-ACP methyl ester carboxylesterase